jgi:hypothetical protein
MSAKPKSEVKKDVDALMERIKAEAERESVGWMIYLARQDEGMADILSRMAKAELVGIGRIKE